MEQQVPTFRIPAQTEVMPPLCRMPHGPYARSRHARPRGHVQTLVLTSSSLFSTLVQRFAFAHLLCPHLSLTLTTGPFDQAAHGGFDACSCKPTPRGLPSSGIQLILIVAHGRTQFISFCRSKLSNEDLPSKFCRRAGQRQADFFGESSLRSTNSRLSGGSEKITRRSIPLAMTCPPGTSNRA